MVNDFDRIVEMHGLPFKADNETLNTSRAAAQKSLDQIRATYQRNFNAFSTMPITSIPFAAVTPSSSTEVKVFDNYEIKGKGDTTEDALRDWRDDLSTKPQAGAYLIWRVHPEIDWMKDFQRGVVIWRVYARFVVLP